MLGPPSWVGIVAEDIQKERAFYREDEVAPRESLHTFREHWEIGGSGSHEVTKVDIDEVVSKWTGIPLTAISRLNRDYLGARLKRAPR